MHFPVQQNVKMRKLLRIRDPQHGGFPKLGYHFGGPQNRDYSIWGLYWDPLTPTLVYGLGFRVPSMWGMLCTWQRTILTALCCKRSPKPDNVHETYGAPLKRFPPPVEDYWAILAAEVSVGVWGWGVPKKR